MKSKKIAVALAATLLAWVVPVQAQTGPELLLKPWATGQKIEAQGDAGVLNGGSTTHSDRFDESFYNTSGRVRLEPEQRADPRFGWNYSQMSLGGDPVLPSQLVDTSVGFGMGIADWNGWLAGLTVGVGYAGAGAFDDSNAYYGMADLLIGRSWGKDESLGFVIDYNGNRTFLPDVPLPGFLYTRRINPTILLGLGFPYSSIEYKPNDSLTLSARFYVPDDFTARVDYAFIKQLGLFAEYKSVLSAYHWDALQNSSDRLIYGARRAEIGARWQPTESINVTLAGGYVFDQEFNVGWDVQDQDRVAKPSDEPYVRAGFEFRY